MTLSLLLSLLFLSINIFFVLAEFSVVRSQAARLEVMHQRGKTRAGLVLNMLKHLDNYLSAIQIGVTMSTLGLGWAGQPTMSKMVGGFIPWPTWVPNPAIINSVLAFSFIIYAQIVFAELVPRYIAIRQAERLALWLAFPLEIYYRLFRFPTWILSKSSIFIARLIGSSPTDQHETAFSVEEMRVLMGTAQEKGLLPLDRLLLIENLFDLSAMKVKEAMVPREKMVCLSTAKSWEENKEILKTHHFSRYPLAEPNIDHIEGFIHVKDLVLLGSSAPDLLKIKRPLPKILDSEPLQPLLKSMPAHGRHIMLCTKPGDKVSGLLTFEDVLEEIVGEVHDEFDALQAWSLHQYLAIDQIDLKMSSSDPAQTIHQLAQKLRSAEPTLNIEFVEQSVKEREQQLPTAIGKGVAVPHARLASLKKPIIAFGRTSASFGFLGPDKTPVQIVFLILTPTSAPLEQLRILSRVATLINNDTVRRQILKAKTAEELLHVIRTSETLVAG